LASAINSFTDFTGSGGMNDENVGRALTSVIGAKSLAASNDIFRNNGPRHRPSVETSSV
jgi:hypothetical protein